MESHEREAYLLNLVGIVTVDGVLTEVEESLLERVRAHIGATKGQLARAVKNAQPGSIDLTALGRLSDRIRCVEDMIEAASADGELAAVEREVLTEAVRALGLTQGHVDVMVREAKARQVQLPRNCPSCGVAAAAGAKFCLSCGARLVDNTSAGSVTHTELVIQSKGITIAFAESTAAGFPAALAAAREQPTFQEVRLGGKRWYAVSFDKASPCLVQVASGLRGLRNRRVFLDGEEYGWDEVLGWTWCSREREQAFHPVRHCFGVAREYWLNPWGCQLLRMNLLGYDTDWLNYGRFIDQHTFVFDKDRILYELRQRLRVVRLCPYLDEKLVAAVMELLPDRVQVGATTGWDYRQTYQPDPSAIRVARTRRYGSFTDTEEFYANGVTCTSLEWPLQLIEAAAKRAGLAYLHTADLR